MLPVCLKQIIPYFSSQRRQLFHYPAPPANLRRPIRVRSRNGPILSVNVPDILLPKDDALQLTLPPSRNSRYGNPFREFIFPPKTGELLGPLCTSALVSTHLFEPEDPERIRQPGGNAAFSLKTKRQNPNIKNA